MPSSAAPRPGRNHNHPRRGDDEKTSIITWTGTQGERPYGEGAAAVLPSGGREISRPGGESRSPHRHRRRRRRPPVAALVAAAHATRTPPALCEAVARISASQQRRAAGSISSRKGANPSLGFTPWKLEQEDRPGRPRKLDKEQRAGENGVSALRFLRQNVLGISHFFKVRR